ncbi:hypothetical protein DFH06DRAFT_1051662 [Mycena polygramma]|nr:hypothetical protein DFH06DRAFT_1051662 [Mycena polygramma]
MHRFCTLLARLRHALIPPDLTFPTHIHPYPPPRKRKMRLRPSRSPDVEKNDAKTHHGSLFTRISAWMSPPQDPGNNNVKSDHGTIFTRIFASIFAQKPGTPVADEEVPLTSRRKKPPYSEAESRQASAKLWSIYIGEAERYDKALVESWKADMEGMLIFSGLFSASLTAFLVESYQTLQPDSGAATVQLLTQISQQLAAPSVNLSLASLDGSEFRARTSSLVCNTLWFISLTLSITCALLATLVEQWAREFLHRTEKHPSPIRRARVFSFLYFGVRRFGMHIVVDLIPLLLHVALMLFLAGLIAFLVPINEFLMGLIGAILGVFLGIYSVITLLPVISSDCPYRTPFSAFAWRLIQPARKMWLGSAAPHVEANLNDVMLDMALQESDTRDQRAIAWTVDSLTDEAELLPFLEAVPEAIHGAKGFHSQNDHMFVSVLNGVKHQESLGTRITDLLLSARNREIEDPLRQRGLIAGLKAIWALGMISTRIGRSFIHEEGLWFREETRRATFYSGQPLPPRKEAEIWPDPIARAAAFAINCSWVYHVRNRLASLARPAHGATLRDPEFTSAVAALLLRLKRLSQDYPLPAALASHITSLESWASNTSATKDTSTARDILLSMMEDDLWLMVGVALLTTHLLATAEEISKGLQLPYEFEATCFQVVPRIPPPPEMVQIMFPITPPVRSGPFLMWDDSVSRDLDPSTNDDQRQEITPLDHVMRSFFRLLPLLKLEDVMPIFTVYLAKRNYAGAVYFATQHCHLAYLLDCLVAMLNSPTEEDAALRAICATLNRTQSEYDDWWHEREDRIYNFMKTRRTFTSPKFLCLSSLIRMRKLLYFLRVTRRLLHLGTDNNNVYATNKPLPQYSQSAMNKAFQEWRILITHPFLTSDLPEDIQVINQQSNAEEMITDIRARARRSMVIYMTEFTLACMEATDQPYLAETMGKMCECQRSPTVDSDVAVNYAKAWITLLNHAIPNSQNSQLQLTIQALFLQEPHYYHKTAAPIFKDALTRYIQFLEDTTDPNAYAMTKAKKVLNELVTRMASDSKQITGQSL